MGFCGAEFLDFSFVVVLLSALFTVLRLAVLLPFSRLFLLCAANLAAGLLLDFTFAVLAFLFVFPPSFLDAAREDGFEGKFEGKRKVPFLIVRVLPFFSGTFSSLLCSPPFFALISAAKSYELKRPSTGFFARF